MSDSRVPNPVSSAGRAGHVWWIVLAAALALLWVATARQIARVEALTAHPTWSVDPPARDATGPTGYAQGQRRLVVPGHHDPSFWWIMEAQQSVAEGRLRLRHIAYDAAPEGRELRRTAPYRWWLIAVGWLQGLVSGEPAGPAIERGALFADPLLLALLLVGGAFYCARFVGPRAAAAFVAGAISLFPLAANFQPGAPDPRSLAWVLALGSLLPLLATVSRRSHFALAGACGGLGFWNDASSQTPVLLAVGLGAAAWTWLRARQPGGAEASLPWRTWAWTGAVTVLAATIFEFAPDHFTWSPDAVHPVHAAAWWGLGEILCAIHRWSRHGRGALNRRAVLGWVGAMLAVAAWPTAILATGAGGVLAPDFHALELANHPQGGVAANLGAWLREAGGGAQAAVLLPIGLLVAWGLRMLLGKPDAEERGRLAFVLAGGVFVAGLACVQLRWWNLFDVFALVGLAVFFGSNRPLTWSWAVLLLVMPALFVGFPAASEGNAAPVPTPREAQVLIARDFAQNLVRRAGPDPVLLFSTPRFSGAAAFYGGFPVVVSNDVNRAGYERAARIASAGTEQEMSVLLQSRGITHVALPLWDPVLDQLVRIGRNLPADQPLPPDALAVALRDWDFPPWMRALDCLVPNEPGLQGFELRAFALQPELEPDQALSQLADFFLERGQIREAHAVTASLEAYPRSVVALGAIANVQLALRDGAGLKETLETLRPHLSRRAARNLPADRRISLATLLLQTRQPEPAKEQLSACLASLDAPTLRTLTPGTLVNLFFLSRSLDLPFPDKELEQLAWELVPPAARSGLATR